MRLYGLIVAFFLVAAAVGSQEVQPSLGFGILEEYNSITVNKGGIQNVLSVPFVGLESHIDLTYFYIGLALKMQEADTSVISTDTSNGSKTATNIANSYPVFLSLRVAGKIPIQLSKGILIFPQVGLQDDLLLGDNALSSTATRQHWAYNYLFIVLGIGADITLSSQLYVRIAVDGDINLTPLPMDPNGGSFSAYNCDGVVSLGIRL